MKERLFESELLDMKKQFDVDNDIEKMEETYHRIKLKERMNKDAGVVSPDTYACDRVFLESFITKEMRLDFHLVAKEFLQQEIMNLSEYEQFQHVQNLIKTTIPERIYEQLVLGLMFGAVKKGNVFAKDLFCYLYKTYYKKEYNQIKRFNKMSFSEVVSITKDSQNEYEEALARILTMSRILGIELAHDCIFLFALCDEMKEESCNDIDKVFQVKIEKKDFEQASDELRDTFVNEDEMVEVASSFEEYIHELFLFIGFPLGYHEVVKIHIDEIELLFTKMLVLLKRANPHRKYRKEDIAMAAVLGKILTLHGILAYNVYFSFCGVLGVYTDYFEDNTTGMLDLSRLPKREKNIGNDKRCDSVIEVQERKTKYNEADLLDEIESLRSRLHCAESMIQQLHTERTEDRQKIMEMELACRQSKENKKELAKLREYVYCLTDQDDEKEQILDDIEENRHILQEKSVVIIGGHVNWVKKMKKEFPKWRFISPGASSTVSASLVQNVDKVYFFTDVLDHSNYYKFLQYIRESGVDFGYIHGVNISNNIVYLYNDLCGEKRKHK